MGVSFSVMVDTCTQSTVFSRSTLHAVSRYFVNLDVKFSNLNTLVYFLSEKERKAEKNSSILLKFLMYSCR